MNSYVNRAEKYIPQLARDALETETQGFVAPATIQALRTDGLLGLLTPKVHEGAESDFETAFSVARTLARGCMSTAWVATVGNVHNWMAAAFHPECQKDYFASADVYSSASFAPTGKATMIEEGFVANGTWGFLSGVDHAQWAFLTAIVPESVDDRPSGPWFLMVPVAEVEVLHDSWQVAGLAGTGSKSVTLDDLFVPRHRAAFLPALRSGKGPGVGTHAGQLYKAPFQPALIAVLAAPILGATEAALNHFTEYTKNRVVKMTGAQQSQQIPMHLIIAEVAATVNAAALILENVFRRIDEPVPLTALEDLTVGRDTAYAVKLLVDAMQKLIANAGGTAAQTSNPLQRAWRDVQVASNHAALNLSTNMQGWGAAVLAEESKK